MEIVFNNKQESHPPASLGHDSFPDEFRQADEWQGQARALHIITGRPQISKFKKSVSTILPADNHIQSTTSVYVMRYTYVQQKIKQGLTGDQPRCNANATMPERNKCPVEGHKRSGCLSSILQVLRIFAPEAVVSQNQYPGYKLLKEARAPLCRK